MSSSASGRRICTSDHATCGHCGIALVAGDGYHGTGRRVLCLDKAACSDRWAANFETRKAVAS